MGNDVSKELKDIANALDVDGYSCMTPTNYVTRYIDPRSPTEEIIRTPIEVRKEFSNFEVLQPLRRRWKSVPESLQDTLDSTSKDFHILNDDPRSPTLGIIRTPIQVTCNVRSCRKMCSNESIASCSLDEASMIVNLPDCRSPSLNISRTPIQAVLSEDVRVVEEFNEVEPSSFEMDTKITPTPVNSKCTITSKRHRNHSFVYKDEDCCEIIGKSGVKQFESDVNVDKENDQYLKRKLVFSPEPLKTGVKVRTPLGSRSNFQDSPSQFLKIMQTQKVDQELGNLGDNATDNLSLTTKPVRKPQSVIEWDNTDSTLVM